jgi:hypothetical protein
MWPSFFDIPVYRLAEKEYVRRQAKHINDEIAEEKQSFYVSKLYENEPTQEEWMRHHLWKTYGGAWDFNEIVGWIRLYFCGDQVRGEWWRIESMNRKSRKKQFEYRDHKFVYEELMDRNISSEAIYKHILDYLERSKADDRLKKHFLDTSVFERIGPFVNWKALLKKSNERLTA